MGAAPLFPDSKPSQNSSNVFPIGVSAPNPVTTTLTVTLPTAQKVHIYNVMGQEVSSRQLYEGSNAVDMSSMEKGVYFFRLDQTTVKVIKR